MCILYVRRQLQELSNVQTQGTKKLEESMAFEICKGHCFETRRPHALDRGNLCLITPAGRMMSGGLRPPFPQPK